ncbi:MAG: M2 family metallopeptidase [Fidelibacterota bacterium]
MKKILLFYLISVLITGCSKKLNERETKLEGFINEHVKIIKPILKQMNLTYWNASISGKKEDYDSFAQLQIKLRKIYSSREDFQRVKEFKESGEIKNRVLERQLTRLYNSYLENQIDTTLLKLMVEKSTYVENKFNTFRGKIDGKEVTNNDIIKILKEERDSERRRKAWEASKQIGEVVAPDLLELVKMRNRAARDLGFDNYYVMMLTLREQDENELINLFSKLKEVTEDPYRRLKGELDSILAERYEISREELRPWHYEDPFFQEAPAISEVDLNNYYRGKDILNLSDQFFEGMGLPVTEILNRSDLYEKEGKDQHAYCTDIDREGDVRILANIKDDERWMGTMLHELGHGVYDLNIQRELPFLLRAPAHIFTTEAVALFFGRLSKNAGWMMDNLSITGDTKAEIEKATGKTLKLEQLIFSRWCQVMVNFERALYKNPDQDLNQLWWDLVEEYQFVKRPEGRDKPDWASKIHITSVPVYYHNYMLGEIMASQLAYYIATEVLKLNSPAEIKFSGNPKIGRYLKTRVFKPGAMYHWRDLLIYATGEPLNPEYFVKQFVL